MRALGPLFLVLTNLLLCGCGPSGDTSLRAIIGAVLIDGTGAIPISDSVVLVSGGRIRAAGPRAIVPVPQTSERVDGRGRFLVPGLVDLFTQPAPAGDYLRYGVTSIAAPQKTAVISELGPARYVVALTEVSTLASVEEALRLGKKEFLGMILDAEDLDPAFLAKMRDLRVVFAPMLLRLEGSGELLARGLRNTGRLAAAGVRIAIASGGSSGADTHREIALLAQAGVTPMQVIVAATSTGADVLGQGDHIGAIAPGKRADLLLLAANPLEDARNLAKVEKVMADGEWKE